MQYLLIAVIICATATCIEATSTTDSSYYTAGVVEFLPTTAPANSSHLVKANLAAYLEIITSIEASNTDIIVFPEGTLNNALQLTNVPAPHERVIPCEPFVSVRYADFLVSLSCAARQVRKYLVINLTEKAHCPEADDPRPCAANGLNVYNTNVVLDREGRVISRYRKVHVYLEAKNTTHVPELAVFDTDFGVRFGHFICFDMLFYTPAEALVVKHGIRDVIFTSMFYSELPFLTGVQLQHSWAWGNNVNLLAAGASNPQSGSTGSGIYSGSNGDLVSLMVGETGVRKLLIAQVPKLKNHTATVSKDINSFSTSQLAASGPEPKLRMPLSGIKLLRDPQLEHFNSQLLEHGATEHSFVRRLCMHGFCCRFAIVTQDNTLPAPQSASVFYKYRIGVYKGKRRYEQEAYSDLQICAIYACTGDSVGSCGQMFDARTQATQANFRFKSIDITGDFDKSEKLLLMPNSLNDQLYPLAAKEVNWSVVDRGNYFSVSHKLTTAADDLLTFGIYANYYDR